MCADPPYSSCASPWCIRQPPDLCFVKGPPMLCRAVKHLLQYTCLQSRQRHCALWSHRTPGPTGGRGDGVKLTPDGDIQEEGGRVSDATYRGLMG